MTSRTYPIVLAHGIARFDALVDMLLDVDNDDALDHKHYFKGIRTHLNSQGFHVWHTQVDWAGSVAKRSSDLKREVEAVLRRRAPRRFTSSDTAWGDSTPGTCSSTTATMGSRARWPPSPPSRLRIEARPSPISF